MIRVGIDWGNDHLNCSNGQFRYATDLLRGLACLEKPPRLTLFGSRDTPPDEIVDLFPGKSGWRWKKRPRAAGSGSDFVNQWRSFRDLRRSPFDILHVIDGTIPFAPPCPVVATCYDLMMEIFRDDYAELLRSRGYRRWRWLSRRVVRRHVAISRATARDLNRNWRVPISRIDVVHLGTASEGIPIPANTVENPATTTVASPYNLEPRKNLSGLLKAMAILVRQGSPVRLTLFGRAAWSEERERRFEDEVWSLGIGDRIVRTGFLADDELRRLYRESAVFVFPSLYEGFGLPVLEAMREGGCVVARNRSAMPEVLGDAGRLVETVDPNALAGAIGSLLTDQAENRRLRTLAVARSREFTVERMARLTYQSYLRALGVPISGSNLAS